MCVFHPAHGSVLHFAYFCSALFLSLVCINVTAVWLSTSWPPFFVSVVCVLGCVVAICRVGGVDVFH